MSDGDRACAPSSRWWNESVALQALVVLILWASTASPVTDVATTSIDASFSAALAEMHARGARAGFDWIYTWGPFGWLANATFDERTFVARHLVGEVAMKLACWTVIVVALWRRRPFTRVVALLALFVLPAWTDSIFLLALYGGLEMLLDRPASAKRAGLLVALVAALSWVKFTLFLVSALFVALAAFALWRSVSRSAALRLVGATFVAWLAAWLVAGQSWLDLPRYLVASMRVASGYEAAMTSQTPEGLVPLAACGIAVVAVRALLALVPALALARSNGRRDAAEIARSLGFAALAFLAFKEGFVRASDHAIFFFAILAPLAATFLPAAERERRPAVRTGALLATILVSFLGLAAVTPVRPLATYAGYRVAAIDDLFSALSAPSELLERGKKQRASMQTAWSMPATRARVGKDAIDVLPSSQGILIENGWSWTPRPVFQSYLTFDAELEAMNARFLEGPRSPRWMLMRIEPLDDRWPTIDDALALRVLARDWSPVGAEQGFLLLRRDDAAPRPEKTEVVLERTIAFDEEVDLSSLGDGLHSLEADVRTSVAGKLRSLAYKLPVVRLRVRTRSGAVHERRIVPGMIRAGAIVDPPTFTTNDWLALYDGEGRDRSASFRLTALGSEWAFEPAIAVRVVHEPLPAPRDVSAVRRALHAPVFGLVPTDVTVPKAGGLERRGDETVYVAHAPSKLRFDVPAGVHRVRGTVGLPPPSPGAEHAPAVVFRAFVTMPGHVPQPVWAKLVDPRAKVEDRVAQPFELEVRTPSGGELVLRAVPADPAVKLVEGAYWGNLVLD